MMNLIVAWSGGLDSTYTLVKLLEEGHFVQAHHVIIKSTHNRWEKESEAVGKIKNVLRDRFGNQFEYTESTIDMREFSNKIQDIGLVCFAVANAIKDFATRHHGRPLTGWTTGSHYHEPRTETIINGFKMIEYFCYENSHIDFGLEGRVTKDQEKDLLKKYGVADYVWSCRYPINGGECGICDTCKGIN